MSKNIAIYLTGAKTPLGEQPIPYSSLGGYISSSTVSDNLLSNLFDMVSQYDKQVNKAEYRIIAIKNTGTETITNLNVFFEYPIDTSESPATELNDCEFSIGYSAPIVDGCGDLSSQRLNSIYARPLGITIYDNAIEAENELNLPNLVVDEYLILYIKRANKASSLAEKSDEDLEAIMDGTLVLDTQEDIVLHFTWDD